MQATAARVLELDGYVSTREAADAMGVDTAYIHRLAAEGRLTISLKVRGTNSRFYREEDVTNYIQTHPRVGLIRKKRQEQSA